MAPAPRALGLSLALVLCPATATAQQPRPYVGGAFEASPIRSTSVSGGSPSTSFVNSATDAPALGFAGEAGWQFSGGSSIGVEFYAPLRRASLSQRHPYVFGRHARVSRYREQTISILLRGVVLARRQTRLTLVGGAVAVQGHSIDRYAPGLSQSTSEYGPFGSESSESHTAFGITTGVDLAIEATRHASVVPHFRMLLIARGDPMEDLGSSFADLGLSRVVYRMGIGVRLAF